MGGVESGRVVVGCILGGLVGGIAIATVWQFESKKDFWDVMTAVGTVGAAMAAVGIAVWQDHRGRQERLVRARVRAAAMSLQTGRARAQLTSVLKRMQLASQFDCAPDAFAAWARALLNQVTWDTADVEALVPLPDGCAYNLAAAIDGVTLTRHYLESMDTAEARYISEERKLAAAYAVTLLAEAVSKVSKAEKTLQDSSIAFQKS